MVIVDRLGGSVCKVRINVCIQAGSIFLDLRICCQLNL